MGNIRRYSFEYEEYDTIEDLKAEDAQLLMDARKTTQEAYAPYSNFCVGAAVRLTNGLIITGANQENASSPAGICAERVLLATLSSRYPGIAISEMAVSYHNLNGNSDQPISPCGICRQSLIEYESRTNHAIRLILGGQKGKIYIVPSATLLLPLGFSRTDLNR